MKRKHRQLGFTADHHDDNCKAQGEEVETYATEATEHAQNGNCIRAWFSIHQMYDHKGRMYCHAISAMDKATCDTTAASLAATKARRTFLGRCVPGGKKALRK
jgi:hypothetical protein